MTEDEFRKEVKKFRISVTKLGDELLLAYINVITDEMDIRELMRQIKHDAMLDRTIQPLRRLP
jgi:hypothetical protein